MFRLLCGYNFSIHLLNYLDHVSRSLVKRIFVLLRNHQYVLQTVPFCTSNWWEFLLSHVFASNWHSHLEKSFVAILIGRSWGSLVVQMVKRLSAMRETQVQSLGREDPWRRKWQPTPVSLPGESHGWRSLVGYSPQGRKESDTTERLHFHCSL